MRDPRLENVIEARGTYATLDTIAGKTLVVLNNEWTSMTEIVAYLSAELKKRFGIAKVLSFSVPTSVAADESVIREAARVGDFALVGLAN